jgi:acid phosphatase
MRFLAVGALFFSTLAWSAVPQSQHIWIVTEENHSYESVIGNSNMPYFNSLANKYGLATQYYAEQHNSIAALMWLVAGQPVTGNNQTTTCYNVDNIARHLVAQGLRWRSYQEDLPFPGFTGISNLNYVRRHNPIIDFTDTCTPGQAINSVPYSQLATDIANHATPNYAYITPNLLHDAHNGPLSDADDWLSQHVPKILALPEFKPGGDGILFVVWDEADLSSNGVTPDNRCSAKIASGCGGRLATLVIGPQVKPHYRSSVRYDHANLLRTVCDALGFASCPGAGAVANPMDDFFNTVDVSTPFEDAVVASPLHIHATAINSSAISAMQVYVDGNLKYQAGGSPLDVKLPVSLGTHHIVVKSSDTAGGIHSQGIDVKVQSQAVVISNPEPNAFVLSSVALSAVGGGTNSVTKMQLYVDGNPQFQSSGNTLNTTVSLTRGPHTLAVEASDSSGNLTKTKFPVTSVNRAVQILSPAAKGYVYGSLYVSATTTDPTPVTNVLIYLDSKLVYQVSGTGVQTTLPVSGGTHSVVVEAWNQSGLKYQKSVTVKVGPVPITISSPAANATVTSPVTISAYAPTNSPVQKMQLYVDGTVKYRTSGKSFTQTVSLSSGKRYIVAKGWDQYGNSWHTGQYITVK